MKLIIGPAIALLSCLGCRTAPEPPAELLGSWRLATVCIYDQDVGPPCQTIEPERAEVIAFEPDGRFTSQRPHKEGRYRVERRTVPNGGEEVLIHLDDAGSAQLFVSPDSLVISWAYVDGAEKRYVPVDH